jgi:pimeloyl-ACP methyl ester carboxylesterase
MDIVLLHCSMSSGAQWRSLARRLEKDGHRVVAPNLLGYGDAPPAPQGKGFSAAHEAVRVAACADSAFGGGSRFHVVGHSYGGMVGLHLARALPRRVASVLAYEPVCFNLLGGRDPDYRDVRLLAEAIALLVRAGRPFDASRRFYDFWNGDGAFGALPLAVQQRLEAVVAKVPLDFAAAFAEPFDASSYGAIEVPALVIAGSQGRPPMLRIVLELAQAMPRASLHQLAGTHMAPVTDPEPFNALAERFLAAHGTRPRLALAA